MSVNGEPTGDEVSGQELESSIEFFPIGLMLSELVAAYRDGALAERLKALVTEAGGLSDDFYREVGAFSSGIMAAMEGDWQTAIGTKEERPLQIRQQVLRQVGQIVLLLDTYWKVYDFGRQDLAIILQGEIDELRSALLDEIDQLLEDESLAHSDYFKSIQQKVKELPTPS